MSNRTYRYFNGKPQFAFGHGLSYTKFKFQDGRLESKKIAADGTAKVTFTVQNTGNRDGDEVAQVYFRHVKSSVPQPKLALCGFTRVHLKRGESSKVTIEVPPNGCVFGTRKRNDTSLSRACPCTRATPPARPRSPTLPAGRGAARLLRACENSRSVI